MINRKKGFTLIELMVVTSVIGALASIILVPLSESRAKARDARRIEDFRNLRTALTLYYQNTGKFPGDYNELGTVINPYTHLAEPSIHVPPVLLSTPTGGQGACDAIPVSGAAGADPNTQPYTLNNYNPDAYNKTMQELVDAKVISAIPHDPGGSGYCIATAKAPPYSGSQPVCPGVWLMTSLETGSPSKTGIPPSTRYDVGQNWCSKNTETRLYCFCIPY
ncbi:MAG: prepilin-type N-terminal cleavage/methylation domain-containing protein [Patescibacteria group bacterium]|nr:prepilin-type N-terminal cleavage/methylation domain-containing protein [Patescibacteria group bacterium]